MFLFKKSDGSNNKLKKKKLLTQHSTTRYLKDNFTGWLMAPEVPIPSFQQESKLQIMLWFLERDS